MRHFNPFTAMLAVSSLGKCLITVPTLTLLTLSHPSHEYVKGLIYKMRSTESRFVIGSSNTLFAGVYVCIFQPGNLTGWGSEGVKKGH